MLSVENRVLLLLVRDQNREWYPQEIIEFTGSPRVGKILKAWEKQGWLTSRIEDKETAGSAWRGRRFYQLTQKGIKGAASALGQALPGQTVDATAPPQPDLDSLYGEALDADAQRALYDPRATSPFRPLPDQETLVAMYRDRQSYKVLAAELHVDPYRVRDALAATGITFTAGKPRTPLPSPYTLLAAYARHGTTSGAADHLGLSYGLVRHALLDAGVTFRRGPSPRPGLTCLPVLPSPTTPEDKAVFVRLVTRAFLQAGSCYRST